MSSGLIPRGQNLNRDPDVIDLDAPRLAWYNQEV